MAVLAGKDGEVLLSSVKIAYIDNFSLSIEAGTAETSQLGDQWREYIGTAKGWSGSFSGTFDYADASPKSIVDNLISGNASTSVTLKFKVSASLTLTGTAWISNGTIGGSHGDKITISFNFQGSGALAAAA